MHVPVGTFKETWERLTKSEAWGHFPGNEPYIGVRGEQGASEAKIATVLPDSPASKAGLLTGDIVTKIDGVALTDFASLSAYIRERQPGDRVKLVVKRGEEIKEIEVKLRNHKSQAVDVVVKENLYRWSKWTILTKTHNFVKEDARTINFTVKVPKDGETVVRYRVRYTW